MPQVKVLRTFRDTYLAHEHARALACQVLLSLEPTRGRWHSASAVATHDRPYWSHSCGLDGKRGDDAARLVPIAVGESRFSGQCWHGMAPL